MSDTTQPAAPAPEAAPAPVPAPAPAAPPRSWRARVLSWVTEGLFLLGIVLAVHAYQVRSLPWGTPPPVAGTGLDGQPIALSSLKGRPHVLHFWATWCGVCKQEEPGVVRVAEDHPVLASVPESRYLKGLVGRTIA